MLNIIIKFLKSLEIVCYLLIGISILNFIIDVKPPEFIIISNDIKLPLLNTFFIGSDIIVGILMNKHDQK